MENGPGVSKGKWSRFSELMKILTGKWSRYSKYLRYEHTLNWVGVQGGVYFWKISGGCLIFEFYCIFMH